MEQTTKGSAAARMAVMYITIGILTVVWTTIWMIWMNRNGVEGNQWYIAYGFMGSGIALTVIGFIMGHVGRAARQADMPPPVPATRGTGQVHPVPGQMPGMMPMAPGPVAAPPPPGAMPQQAAPQQVAPQQQAAPPV